MRILQIVDSLAIGGAEKMALNYANALADKIEFSGLVATRKEGELKNQLQNKTHYLFLNKKNKLDLPAVFRLKKYCIENKIVYLQAHSSSFFTAFLVKVFLPSIRIIWHDHNGLSEFISKKKSYVLKFVSYFFDGIIVVNYKLKNWADKELNCKKVIYLANFTTLDFSQLAATSLYGIDKKRILYLANLRFQKNHFLLIEVAKKLKATYPDWSFHIVGKDFNDEYAAKVKNEISSNSLQNSVFIYGSRKDTQHIISQSEIAILTSQSEGLPVVLLEYGLNKKAVVSTNVGEIPLIIQDNRNGFVVPNYDHDAFYESLLKLIENPSLRIKFGEALWNTITEKNSESVVIDNYINWLQE